MDNRRALGRPNIGLIAVLALLSTLGMAVIAAPLQAQGTDPSPTTSLVESDGQSPAGNIVPRPNTGQAPDSPNDPGGWQQYMVFALIFAGLAIIVLLAVRESRNARSGRARSGS